MKLLFLGTGTSLGVPLIGCSCPVCCSTNPQDKRYRSSAILKIESETILLDAGPDLRMQLLKNKITTISSVLLTHAHYDHMIGLDDLRPLSKRNPIPVYSDKKTISHLHNIFNYIFSNQPKSHDIVNLSSCVVYPMEEFSIKQIKIMPLTINHGNLDILGYKIGNLAYISDAKMIPEQTIKELQNIDTLVLGCLRASKPHPQHIIWPEAKQLIEKIKARQIFLIHMDHETSAKEWAKILPENVKTAYDGLEINIPDNPVLL